MSDLNELNKAAYVRLLRSKNRADTTINSYCAWIDDLADWNHHQDVMDLEQSDLEEYFGYLLEELKDTSVGVAFRSLRAFYNWAVRDELIEVSPMAKLTEPSVQDIPPELATDEELKALLKACSGKSFEDRRDTAMIRLFCEPGTPRRAEMARIRLENLDMRGNKVDFKGKGSKWRAIPFGVKTGRALDFYLRMRAKHPFAGLEGLWVGQRGPFTMWGIRQMLVRRCRRAGIRLLKPHQLRHTSYHHWREQGGSEDDAEVLFGWSPGSRMSRLYGRSTKISRAEKAARKLSVADRL